MTDGAGGAYPPRLLSPFLSSLQPRDTENRTTVFRRAVEKTYNLKMKASRHLITEVNRRFPTLPFTIRSMADEREARMGLSECTRHGLLHLYPVLTEKEGVVVAHFKFTILMLPSGPSKVTGLPLPPQFVSDKTALCTWGGRCDNNSLL